MQPTGSPTPVPSAAPTQLDPVVTASVNTTTTVNLGNETNATAGILPEARYLRGLEEFLGCAPDAVILALEETTAAVLEPTLSAPEEKLARVDTLDCERDGPFLKVTQEVVIEFQCSDDCGDKAAELASSNDLAESIGASINEAITSNAFTETLKQKAAECQGAGCGALQDAKVDDLVEVVAGPVTVTTLSPTTSLSPSSSSPTKKVRYAATFIMFHLFVHLSHIPYHIVSYHHSLL